MRLFHVLILFLLNIIIINARSIMTTTAPTQISVSERPTQETAESNQSRVNSIHYKVSDSSQVDIQFEDSGEEEHEEDADESTLNSPTVDPAFVELSRQAFLRLNQGEQYVKPVVQTDEQRRLMWLTQHQKGRTEERKNDNQLPGKRQIMTLTTDNLDKNQTCYGERFKHKIRMAGCEPKVIMNSCAACVPVETDFVKVELDCPDRPEKQMFRTVVRVKRCACRNIQFGDDSEED